MIQRICLVHANVLHPILETETSDGVQIFLIPKYYENKDLHVMNIHIKGTTDRSLVLHTISFITPLGSKQTHKPVVLVFSSARPKNIVNIRS